jgi:hypothetical protein
MIVPPGRWVVVEKILEGEETLPEDWPCAGTTGYDALARGAAVEGFRVRPACLPGTDAGEEPACLSC